MVFWCIHDTSDTIYIYICLIIEMIIQMASLVDCRL